MFVKALRAYGVTAPLDVQLTATDVVDTLIEEFAAAGANYITRHPVSLLDARRGRVGAGSTPRASSTWTGR